MKSLKTYIIASTFALTSSALFADEIDGVIAVVNNGVVLKSDVANLKRTVLANTDRSKLPPTEILDKQILDQLILEELQIQEARKLDIRIDDIRLDQAIASIAKDKNLSLVEMRQRLARQGIGWSDYRNQIRKEMLIAEVRNAMVRRRINILPQEVQALVKQLKSQNQQNIQYQINHIQLNINEDAGKSERQETFAKANDLVKELKNGADFAAVAIANSSGSKALNGGNWGWLRLEEMPTIFADEVKSKNKGDIIGPFRSGVGYHIIKIGDIRGMQQVNVTEVNSRHILIKPSIILDDAATKRQLEQIRKQIISKQKSFAIFAKEYSADQGSAAKGGELGWQTTDMYVPEFKKALDTMPENRISQPFKTMHGWHIVEVLGRRKADRTEVAFENQAYRMLFNRKFNDEAGAWIQELKAGAYVENMENINSNE